MVNWIQELVAATAGFQGTVKQNALLFSGRAALVYTCHWVQDFSPARSLFRFLNPASERNPEKRDVPPFSGGVPGTTKKNSHLGSFSLYCHRNLSFLLPAPTKLVSQSLGFRALVRLVPSKRGSLTSHGSKKRLRNQAFSI